MLDELKRGDVTEDRKRRTERGPFAMRCNIQDRPNPRAQRSAANLFVRVDLANGLQIGPEQIALLEAIRSTGSISAAERVVGMSHRWAWLLVHEITLGVKAPAVTAAPGGRGGGRAIVTPTGEHIISLYRAIEAQARSATSKEFEMLKVVGRAAKRSSVKNRRRPLAGPG
jgi:molybdate transport system regulatory protein